MKKTFLLILMAFFISGIPTTEAAPKTSHILIDALDTVVKYLIKDVEENNEKLGRVALLVSVDTKLHPDAKPHLIRKIESELAEKNLADVAQCFQCEAVLAHSDGARIVVQKGITSTNHAKEIAKSLSLDSFLDINVTYTGNRLMMQAKAIATGDQKTLWHEEYVIRERFLTDSGFVMSFDLGPAYVFSADDFDEKFGLGVALFLGERFYGIGRIGLGISSVVSAGNLAFNQSSGPYISANLNEIFGFYFPWGDISVFVNPGYAVSQRSIGFVMRQGVQVGLGNFTHINADFQVPLYSQNSDKKYPTSAFISFGFDIF